MDNNEIAVALLFAYVVGWLIFRWRTGAFDIEKKDNGPTATK